MKIVIFGGSGLVGSAFKRLDTNHELLFPSRKDCNLVSYLDVYCYLDEKKPDWVINCAGHVGGVKANIEQKEAFFFKNTQINMNVIEACMQNNIPNLISFMSTCIFPDEIAKSRPLKEEDLHQGEPHSSNYPYAYAKRMIDIQSRIARERGFNYSCLIPTNIFGWNDNYNLETSHLVPALIHKAYLNEQLTVWGTGTPIREFIYDLDIARIVFEIIEKNIQFDNLIVSSNKNYTIKEIAEKIGYFFETKAINFDSSYPDGQFKKETDISKFYSLFPDFKFTPINKALGETAEYFLKNYKNIRK